MVDVTLEDDGDGLEPAVGMLREAGDRGAVVHGPAVLAREVLAEIASGQRGVGTHGVADGGGEVIAVVDGEEEGVDARPLVLEGDDLADGGHGRSFAGDVVTSSNHGRGGGIPGGHEIG